MSLAPPIIRAENPEVAMLLQKGDAEVNRHALHEALGDFESAEKLEPDNVGVLLRISQQCSDLIASAKNSAEGQRLAQRSLDHAKRAVELAPNNAKAHLALAIAYGRMTDFCSNKTKLEYSRYIKAEAERAVALDPGEDFAYHVLGRWHYGVANLNSLLKMMAKMVYGGMPAASNEEAARCLKKAADLAPQRVIHHNELARVYVALGKRDLARKEWQTVVTLHAEDGEDEKAQREARTELAKK
jgi:tetratricopeptide (TPR) repeat protein